MNEIIALYSLFIAIIATPGPNNTILFVGGVNNGYIKTLPLLLSVNFGVICMLSLSYYVGDYILNHMGSIMIYLKYLSIVLLIYIAYQMWNFKEEVGNDKKQIIGLFFFQFLNPKIWVISISIINSFISSVNIFVILLMALSVGLVFNSLWVVFGMFFNQKINLNVIYVSKVGSVLLLFSALYLMIK